MPKKLLPVLAATLVLGAGTPPPPADQDPRALMIQARILQREGGSKAQAAAALYKKVIALVPTSAQAHLRLSEALLESDASGNLAAAVDPAVKATELDPKSGEAWAHLGLLYFMQSQNRDSMRPAAVAALRRAVQLLPADAELWTRLAQLQDSLRDSDGAMHSWLAVGRLHPSFTYQGKVLADYAWERAMELGIQQKNYEARREAVLALCDRISPDPRYLKYLDDLAQDQVESGFLGHAEESFRLLGQYLPLEPLIWENVALIQLRTGRFEQALQTLAKAESMRKSPRTSFNIGMCLMKLGRFPEAEERWKALLPALGGSEDEQALAAGVKELYATCLLFSGRPKTVLEMVAGWPETAAQPAMAALRAQALIQTGDFKKAQAAIKEGMAKYPQQELFQRAAELPPKALEEGRFFKGDFRRTLVQLDLEAMAGLWAQFRSWQRCLDAVLEARKAAPVRDVELLLLQANALENLGRPDQAIQVLREGQKLNPGHPVLQNNLGFSILERGGDLDEAARLIQSALAQDPGNASTMDSWGWVLFKQGKTDDAEAALRKAAEMAPYSPEVHKHLGEVLLKQDRLQDALDEWERALAFAFPERKALEEQVQNLRTRLAKAQAANPNGEGGEDEGEDDGAEEEGNP